jgi:sugar lactone lactonase YvrE
MNMKTKRSALVMAATWIGLAIAPGIFSPQPLQAQGNVPKYEVDPSWPKPLPDNWVTGQIGGVCIDAQDHVFALNRRGLTDNELDAGRQAPPVIEFDPEGNVVNSWGDPDVLPNYSFHACMVDNENNVWLTSVGDGILQKWSHDGSKLLLQIGKKGIVDSSDGTTKGAALNSSHTAFFKPADIVIDPSNGDVYVADGENPGGNHRVAVFDRNGQFLRQWELHRTAAETGDRFVPVLHCVAMDNDGNVYVCDRSAHRVQVFDKMGNFKKNIPVPFEQRSQYSFTGPDHVSLWGWVGPGGWGSAVYITFSRDRAQKFMFIANEDDEQIEILDRASGQILSHFGRAGHQVGEFNHIHYMAVDPKGNIFTGEVFVGERVQKFKIVGSQ